MKEIHNETKIIDKSSGKIIVQIVVDEPRNTPVQEIYTHVVAEQIILHNWKENWELIWEAQFKPENRTKGEGEGRRSGKGKESASESESRKNYNQQREADRSERNNK